ncbi:isoleucine--tRNA ligase [Candidatus Parcubacteria bacterium]|nr:isoleucine--tRNA ligase [Candidatus Parcubacteria bacterium]
MVNQKKNIFSDMEKQVFEFWERGEIFKKSVLHPGGFKEQDLQKNNVVKDYVFYDGPPFATGLPHYGHIVGTVMKDVVPRYWTMNGKRVERKWGWDCHGLPIENIVEKEMGSQSKKDVEKKGVKEFNELCRSKVLSYVDDWEKIIKKIGRWADMENAYKTMDIEYMESVWWVFKSLWDKDLIYKDYRSMHVCPRCETTLSQSEVAEGYKDIKDLSCVVKFELKDLSLREGAKATTWQSHKTTEELNKGYLKLKKDCSKTGSGLTLCNDSFVDSKTFVLAWTTTPWTLIGNVALAVGEDIDYVKVGIMNHELGIKEYYIIAKERLSDVFEDKEYEITEEFKGRDLIGKEYKPLVDYYSSDEKLENVENGWKIYGADFVTTEDGTGVVHIAPAFGEDDMQLGKENKLPFVQHVKMDGYFKDEVEDFKGLNVKPKFDKKDGHITTDIEIIKYLAHKNLLFSKKKYEHSYPHCWRCDTPLINYATSSWFVNITKIKPTILDKAKDINWSPEHIKKGRFGKWLEGARDWSISRQRFWASVMPIWECECGERKVFGSVKELEEISGQKITDIHKHIVDDVTFKCEKCGATMKRVPDVLDTWFDSGSMPYAQMHYPFENKEKFEANFPAEFIAEGSDQTRCWFYYMHALACGLKETNAFKNVIVNGIALAEDGKKMSKKLQNYPDPMEVMEQYGADALRYYLLTSPVMLAENLCFSEDGVKDALRKVIMISWNVVKFYSLFADRSVIASEARQSHDKNVLDQWIILRLNELITESRIGMEKYDLPHATRPIVKFIDDLSTWYVRRSRDRFKGDDEADKNSALATTKFILIELSKVMAPFTPFVAEQIWQNVTGYNFKDENKSVHLESFPVIDSRFKDINPKILDEMNEVRKIVEMGLSKRDEFSIKIRQPLSQLKITNYELQVDYEKLILDELNVKSIVSKKGDGDISVDLDTEITEELKLEGLKREMVRFINVMRKNLGLTIKDRVDVGISSEDSDIEKVIKIYAEDMKGDVLADIVGLGVDGFENVKEVKVNGIEVKIGVKKI